MKATQENGAWETYNVSGGNSKYLKTGYPASMMPSMGRPSNISARIKNFSKTFFTPLPASFDEFLKSQIHHVLGFIILYFFSETIYNNHENTKFKYGFRVFAISCFRDVFLVLVYPG